MSSRVHTSVVRRAGPLLVVLTAVAFFAAAATTDIARGSGEARSTGRLIVYETTSCTYDDPGETCTSDLWTVDVRNGRRKLLTGGSDAAWSPDGRQIAFVGAADFTIWVMNADGSAARRIGRKYDDCCSAPSWSSDGRRIAYGGGRDDSELVVVNADGSGRRVLTRMPAGVDDPAWSPDGKQIAYLTFGFGKSAIYIIGADGKGRRRLAGASGGPSWSPDGRQIAFTAQTGSNDTSEHREVFVIRPDGSGLRQLTRTPDPGSADGGTWSPDGRRLLFVSGVPGEAQLYLMSADGSGQRKLTRDKTRRQVSPDWSPDGRRVVYETYEGIYVVGIDGTGQRQLTTDDEERPLWQPLP